MDSIKRIDRETFVSRIHELKNKRKEIVDDNKKLSKRGLEWLLKNLYLPIYPFVYEAENNSLSFEWDVPCGSIVGDYILRTKTLYLSYVIPNTNVLYPKILLLSNQREMDQLSELLNYYNSEYLSHKF